MTIPVVMEIDGPSTSTSSSSMVNWDHRDPALEAHAKVLAALASIGAQSFGEYLIANGRGSASRGTMPSDGRDEANGTPEDEDDGDVVVLNPSGKKASPPSPASPSSEKVSRTKNGCVHPITRLPISPSSRLSKKLARSETGMVHEVFAVSTDKGFVSQLHEFCQAAGLQSPEFQSVTMDGVRCSPDHFVSTIFYDIFFEDQDGKASIKAGRECVARKVLEHYFPDSFE